MSIERVDGYRTPDGRIFDTLEIAERHWREVIMVKKMKKLLESMLPGHVDNGVSNLLAHTLMERREEVKEILK